MTPRAPRRANPYRGHPAQRSSVRIPGASATRSGDAGVPCTSNSTTVEDLNRSYRRSLSTSGSGPVVARVNVTAWSSSVGTNVVMIALMAPSLRPPVTAVKPLVVAAGFVKPA